MPTHRSPVWLHRLLVAAVCLPALVVFLVLLHEAVNIPILDDYNVILIFSLHWLAEPSSLKRALLVISFQDSDYKLLFAHTLLALQLSVLPRISLPFLLACGNLSLLPIWLLCWKTWFADRQQLLERLLLFLPVSFLLLQLNYAETLDWAMGALQNLPVIAFSFAAIFLLSRPGRAAFPLACLFSAGACASSGNGFLLAPIGLLVLLPHRSLRRTLAWLCPFPVMLALYLYHYHLLLVGSSGPLSLKLLFFLSFIGSAFENISGLPVRHLAIFFGLLICLVVGHAARTRFDRRNPTAFFFTLWILLTAALVAEARSRLGLPQSLSVRYKIYCDLLLIFCYGYAADRVRLSSLSKQGRRRLYAVVTTAIIAFSAVSDVLGYHFLEKRRQRILTGAQQFLADPAHTTPMINPNDPAATNMRNNQELARQSLNQAIQTGIYTLPPALTPTPAPKP